MWYRLCSTCYSKRYDIKNTKKETKVSVDSYYYININSKVMQLAVK